MKKDSKDGSNSLAIKNEFNKKLLIGDHIYTVDFVRDDKGEYSFDAQTFEISKIIDNKLSNTPSYYEIFDVRFPKVIIKSDLASGCGFFSSKQAGAEAIVNSMKVIYEKSAELLKTTKFKVC